MVSQNSPQTTWSRLPCEVPSTLNLRTPNIRLLPRCQSWRRNRAVNFNGAKIRAELFCVKGAVLPNGFDPPNYHQLMKVPHLIPAESLISEKPYRFYPSKWTTPVNMELISLEEGQRHHANHPNQQLFLPGI